MEIKIDEFATSFTGKERQGKKKLKNQKKGSEG